MLCDCDGFSFPKRKRRKRRKALRNPNMPLFYHPEASKSRLEQQKSSTIFITLEKPNVCKGLLTGVCGRVAKKYASKNLKGTLLQGDFRGRN